MTERGYQKTGGAAAGEGNTNFQNESVMSNSTATAQTTKRPMTSNKKSPRIVDPRQQQETKIGSGSAATNGNNKANSKTISQQ